MKKISILVLLAALCYTATAQEAKWENLFDGKTLKGWKPLGGTATFKVDKGEIVGMTSKTPDERINTFLCTEKEYGNFNLEFEFKVDEALNSGVQFRGIFTDGLVRGYQYEIDPDRTTMYTAQPSNFDAQNNVIEPGREPRSWTGGIYDEKRRGWLYDLTRNPAARAAFKPGQWNKGRIEAYKDGVRTYINGILASTLVDYMTPNGFIGLQVHWQQTYKSLEVRFRNIRIQNLGLNSGEGEMLDKFVGEWQDPRTNYLAQIYVDKKTQEYKVNVSKVPFANADPFATLDGKLENGRLSFANAEGYTGEFTDKNFVIKGAGLDFEGKKLSRKSPTLGAVPPSNAVVLFDGHDLNRWGGLKPKDWLTYSFEASETAKLTPAGDIQMIPGNQSIISKQEFGEIEHLHLEFRLLGEQTNGGVYMMSRFEFNIKDSYGQGKGSSTGAFGNMEYPEPEFNYALPPHVWQTLDIQFTPGTFDAEGKKLTNARTTLYLNGELIYKDVELPKTKGAGGGGQPETNKGPIYLQEHGTAYEFRNIWVVEGKNNK